MSAYEGGCLCGGLRWRAENPPLATGFCHCRMCQRIGGAPTQAYAVVPLDGFAFLRGQPKVFRSSDRGERLFCPTCGSSIGFRLIGNSSDISLNLGGFDRPQDFPPQAHIYCESQMPWLKLDDELPRFDQAPPES